MLISLDSKILIDFKIINETLVNGCFELKIKVNNSKRFKRIDLNFNPKPVKLTVKSCKDVFNGNVFVLNKK